MRRTLSRLLLWCCAALPMHACSGTGAATGTGTPFLPGSCTTTRPGEGRWTIGGFYKSSQLVDPHANPLVARIRVGESVPLWLAVVGQFCGTSYTSEWISTNPQVARLEEASTNSATLRGASAGEAIVYANVFGSRADLFYYCCPPCVDVPPAPPSCQQIPVSAVRVEP